MNSFSLFCTNFLTHNEITVKSNEFYLKVFNYFFIFYFFFSPSGKLVQIEYALAAVAAGAPSVGIKGWFIYFTLKLY